MQEGIIIFSIYYLSKDGDDSDEDNDTDDDTVTDLPSSKLQFDSDDDSYDEDQHFSQQASFFN